VKLDADKLTRLPTENQTLLTFLTRGSSIIFIFAYFVIYVIPSREECGWSRANFCEHICRSSEVLFALCHQFYCSVHCPWTDEMLFNFVKAWKTEGVEKPTPRVARRFRSSRSGMMPVKPVEDKHVELEYIKRE